MLGKKKSQPEEVIPSNKRVLNDMRWFFRRTDWMEWFEEFNSELDPSGLPKYKTVRKFAKAKASSKMQEDFIAWFIGARIDDSPLNERYNFAQPQDWMHKRATGGWYSDQSIKLAAREVRQKMDSLARTMEVGDKFILNDIARLDKLSYKLDEAFRGELFIPDQDLALNYARASRYLDLHGELIGLKGRLQEQYAKSQGINYNDMSGLADLITASSLLAKQSGQIHEKSRTEKAMEQILEMAMIKAAKYKIQLPEDLEAKLIEATPEVDVKKKVQ